MFCEPAAAAGRVFATMATSVNTPAYVRSTTPPVPAGTKPLQHQVAGHVFGRRNGQNYNKIGTITATLFLLLL